MNPNWKNPGIVVGPAATGDYYFQRPGIVQMIWESVGKGCHVLLAAPRRVGKTSVMLDMMGNPPADTRCIFQNIQGIKSEAEYYQRFYELLVQCLNRFQKGREWLGSLIKDIKIVEITADGVKFGDKDDFNFAEGIKNLLSGVAQNNIRVVLLLDELPEVLNTLHKRGRGEEASNILNHMRELRQNPNLREHLNLVLAGSVGIQHVVKNIEGRISDLNDFDQVPFEALDREEAKTYIAWATKGATIQYDAGLKEHLLDLIGHFIPYFINLMLDEVNKAARKRNNPTPAKADIDAAFDAIVKNSDHFKEWKNRLSDYFNPAEQAYLHEVLVCTAHEGRILPRRLYDYAVKHQLQQSYMELMRGLEHDGYVAETAEGFVFISPVLRAYWKNDNPFFEA
jgi:hypothetical protein